MSGFRICTTTFRFSFPAFDRKNGWSCAHQRFFKNRKIINERTTFPVFDYRAEVSKDAECNVVEQIHFSGLKMQTSACCNFFLTIYFIQISKSSASRSKINLALEPLRVFCLRVFIALKIVTNGNLIRKSCPT